MTLGYEQHPWALEMLHPCPSVNQLSQVADDTLASPPGLSGLPPSPSAPSRPQTPVRAWLWGPRSIPSRRKAAKATAGKAKTTAGAALSPTFIVVIAPDVPMPGHRAQRASATVPYRRTLLRHRRGADRGRNTSAAPFCLPPGLCTERLRMRDVIPAHDATASYGGHGWPPGDACALASCPVGPPTSELTDVDLKAGNRATTKLLSRDL